MAKRILYLVRHAQYASTTTPPEEPDGALTALGERQAAALAERLAQLPIQRIHHSTTQRGSQTAAIISARLPGASLHPAPLLRECVPCVPVPFRAHFASIPEEFLQRGLAQAPQAFAAYFTLAPREHGDQHELLVSHGNLIGYLLSAALGAPCEAWVQLDIDLACLSMVTIGSQGLMKVTKHNDAAHLPQELRL